MFLEMAYPLSIDELFQQDVQEIVEETAMFRKNSFSPGIWAGMEGCVINFNGRRYKILEVDMNNKQLHVKELGIMSGAI